MDFQLTPNGDISFCESNIKNESKIFFYKTKTKVLRINFNINRLVKVQRNVNSLLISFNYEPIKNNKKINIVTDEAYLMQQILIRIKTSLGELPSRGNIGSEIETIIHKDLNDSKTIEKLKQIVSESIKDILDDYKITAKAKISYEDGYSQNVIIKIIKENETFFTYKIGW